MLRNTNKLRLSSTQLTTQRAVYAIGLLSILFSMSGCKFDVTLDTSKNSNSNSTANNSQTTTSSVGGASQINNNGLLGSAGNLLTSATGTTTSPATKSNDYIVVFKNSVTAPLDETNKILSLYTGAVITTHFNNVLKGFAIKLPVGILGDAFMTAMKANPLVSIVEPDLPISVQASESNADWGLNRLSQRNLPLNGSYTYNNTGAGVHAYVVDSGILASNVDFSGRVDAGVTAINDGNGSTDCYGHGTHVAGIIGSNTFGVAKSVTLVPVRVLDCNGAGTVSEAISGLDWIAQNGIKPAVVNLSIESSASTSFNSAIANTVNAGYTVVVAAGNNNADACGYSPSQEPSAIVVGATDNTDARASYSNYGQCLTLFAPGSNIQSTYDTSTTATAYMNGTSMASPHVAGVAALILQGNPGLTPAQIRSTITNMATANIVSNPGTSSPNLLLNMQGY